ncbi:ABC transporter permease [Paludibacter jiangxiensis]|uniref:Putative ABC transport system permease protein n=1 Tax=Paludibacter jiangxiensis TaxID=681398 RepID=A0A161LS65_9BACT|nr:ABC transporter permease [Paludibacter jiangxiensis]GAT63520.1 putative ABC transport system permease protein [Paludibacter jiangxiensis]
MIKRYVNFSNLFKIALRALSNNKFRGFLTMLGIIIGVASVITMLAIGQGSKRSIQGSLSEMGSNMIFVEPGQGMMGGVRQDASSMQTLKQADYQALVDQSEYLSDITPIVSAAGQAIYGTNNTPTSMSGVNASYLNIRKYTIADGDMFTDQDIKAAAKVCVIGKTVVTNLFTNGEDPVGKVIRFKNIPMRVVGVLTEKGNNSMGQDQDDVILAPYTTVMKRISAINYFNNISASARSEAVSDSAQDEMETILRKSHKLADDADNDFRIRSQKELLTMMTSTSDMMTVLLAAIAAISLLVGGIGIMNIMYVSVTERTREIGLRMSIGARGIDILLQFLIEAILISVTGGVIGVIFGVGVSLLVKIAAGWPIFIQVYTVFLAFAVCTATGIFFGWYPARKASNLDPIEALRYE